MKRPCARSALIWGCCRARLATHEISACGLSWPATFHLEILLGSNLESAQARRLVDQQIAGTFGVHGLAKSEALRVFATKLVEFDGIGVSFCAFGYAFHSEIMRERDDRAQDHRPRSARRGPHEGLIDLDRVEGEALQVSK